MMLRPPPSHLLCVPPPTPPPPSLARPVPRVVGAADDGTWLSAPRALVKAGGEIL